jgi:hypothetical protein
MNQATLRYIQSKIEHVKLRNSDEQNHVLTRIALVVPPRIFRNAQYHAAQAEYRHIVSDNFIKPDQTLTEWRQSRFTKSMIQRVRQKNLKMEIKEAEHQINNLVLDCYAPVHTKSTE